LGICIFMALVPVLNSAFYAFNTSYYARWFYMPILLMCLATVSLTEDSKVDWGYGFKWVAGITAAITLVIAFFPREVEEGKYTFGLFTPDNGTVYNYTLLSWIFIGLSLLFIISLIIVVSYSKKHPLSFLKTLLSVLILASLVAYGVEFYRHNNQGDYTYMIRFWITSFIAIVSLLILYILLKLLKSNRKAFYTSATACVCIISAIYGNVYVFSGRQHSYDIKEVMIDQLIEGEMGVADDSEYRIDVYDGVDNTSMYLGVPGINAFHSVVPSSIFEFYDFIGVERSVGSRPDTDVAPIRSLLSVKYLLNPKCGDSFLDEENEPKMYGFKYLKTYNDYYIYENENHIPYGFSYDYYMNYDFCEQYSENSRTGMMLKAMLLNEEQIKKYGDYMTDISELEEQWYTEEGTTLLLTEESQEYDSRKLAETSATTFERDNGGFTAIVERDRENLVFFSVPYDEGWSATVNGEEVEIEKVNAGFMAVPVPVGRSTVRFQYTTPGLGKGILISVISCSVLVLYGAICYLIRRKKGEGYTKYPEGDILIKTWKMQQLSEAREQIENYNAPVKPSLLEKAEKSEHESTETDFKGGFEINTDLFKEK